MEQLKKETMGESNYHKPKDDEDSDGESEDQDLPMKEKVFLIKSDSVFMLPRVSKTTKEPIQIKPGLAEIGRGLRGDKGSSKMVWKHEPSSQAKPVNVSHEYTDYLLKNIQTLNSSPNRSVVHTLAAIKKQQKIK